MSGRLMRAEIAEQPKVLARLAMRFDEHAAAARALTPSPPAGIAFVARGSSDHAAVYGRYLTELASASSWRLRCPSCAATTPMPQRDFRK